MVSFRNVPPSFESWKNRDHSVLCFPDGSVFSHHSVMSQKPCLLEKSWGNALTGALTGIIAFSSDTTANGDSDRISNDRHFLGCTDLKDFPLKKDFGNKLIEHFWFWFIFRLDSWDATPTHRFYNQHHSIFTACSSIYLFYSSSIN